jgi:NAD(P)-dependent dehydrogenase (short-subunit alcohol dehydrogenase family)
MSSMSPSDNGRTAVVTGGAKGIGLACSDALHAAGFQVVALGRDQQALESTGYTNHTCDVTDEASVAATFGLIGVVDVLINNAGVSMSAPLHRTSLTDWNEAFAVNATGAFLCTRAVLPGMRDRGRGRIVTIASTSSHTGSPYIAAYAASKHAVLGLMRVVAAEVAGTGVTANSVCPTFVRTEMTERSIANIVERTGRSPTDAEQTLASQSALGRLVEADEVAAAVLYLCSDAAASVNGQSIILDGGTIQS